MSKTKELFAAADDDGMYLKFELVQNRRSNHPDLHAFLLLESLVPAKNNKDLIGSAAHDVFFIDVDIEALDKVIPPEVVQELRQCGVMYDTDYDCLSMFA